MEIKTIKQKQGFTLIELIIAIAIMGMLATITLAGFSQGNKRRSVVLGTDTIISALRTAQNDSLNPQPISGSCSPDNIPVEYHVTFISSNQNFLLQAKNKCGNLITLQSFVLPQNVRVAAGNNLLIDGNGVGAGGGALDIKFTPPFGTVAAALNGASLGSFTKATVTIESRDSQVTKKVTIDGISGRIDVE